MKPLHEQNIFDKARLLHALFPGEINRLLSFIEQASTEIVKNPGNVKDNWGNNPTFSADTWIRLAGEIQHIIAAYRRELVKKKGWFSDQLFDGYRALYTTQCLQNYTLICPNKQLAKTIELLIDV